MFVCDQPEAFHSLESDFITLESFMSFLSILIPVIMTVSSLMYETQGVHLEPTLRGAVGNTSTREQRGYQARGEAALC